MALNQQVNDFLLGFSGCNGGKLGNPDDPSIWICGIEWGGGSFSSNDLQKYIDDEESWKNVPTGDSEMLTYKYGVSTMKLLTAIDGGKVRDYKQFFEQYQPNIPSSKKGIFLLNLYPLAFKDTDPARWLDGYQNVIGFKDKSEYVRWCRRYRFPKFSELVNQHKPKLVICYGLGYEDDFNTAFCDGYTSFIPETIDGLKVLWKKNDNGTVVAVLPFPNVANSLQRDSSYQLIGEFLAEKIK